jgi:hypothetical protein
VHVLQADHTLRPRSGDGVGGLRVPPAVVTRPVLGGLHHVYQRAA